jgi:hypothetical protein
MYSWTGLISLSISGSEWYLPKCRRFNNEVSLFNGLREEFPNPKDEDREESGQKGTMW